MNLLAIGTGFCFFMGSLSYAMDRPVDHLLQNRLFRAHCAVAAVARASTPEDVFNEAFEVVQQAFASPDLDFRRQALVLVTLIAEMSDNYAEQVFQYAVLHAVPEHSALCIEFLDLFFKLAKFAEYREFVFDAIKHLVPNHDADVCYKVVRILWKFVFYSYRCGDTARLLCLLIRRGDERVRGDSIILGQELRVRGYHEAADSLCRALSVFRGQRR